MLHAILRSTLVPLVLALALLNLPYAAGSEVRSASDSQAGSAVYLPLLSVPTHNRLTFGADVGVASEIWAYLIDANGAHQQQLPLQMVRPTSTSPTWSPDGKQIALFHASTLNNPVPSQDYSLAAVAVATNQVIMQITLTDTQLLSAPVWSPTANDIAFRTSQGLYLLRENMTQPEVISATTELYNPEGAFDPVWSPDGRWISVHDCVVRVQKPYTTSCVPHQNGIYVYRLVWAPNSQQLGIETLEDSKSVISVANVNDLAHRREIARDVALQWLWTPDSRMIVTLGVSAGGNQVLVFVPLDSTPTRQVPVTRPVGNLLAWSPDGTQIVYTQPDTRDGTMLVFIRPDGTVRSTIPLPRVYDNQTYWVVWSADSSALVLLRQMVNRGCPDQGSCREFEVLRPDGTILSPYRLTRTIPEWSPK